MKTHLSVLTKKINSLANIQFILSLAVIMFIPFFGFAQTVTEGSTTESIESILAIIRNILNIVIPVLMVLATVIFLYGVITYITAAGDEEKLASSRKYIIWGLVALFVMVVIWGLVTVLINTFGVQREVTPLGPQQEGTWIF